MVDFPNIASQGKFRRGTVLAVEFPTLPSLTKMPRRVDLYQKQNHHDVLVMEYATASTAWVALVKTGVPVVFKWSQGNVSNEWVGYVSHLSFQAKPGREKVMEVHCVAASYPLKQRTNKVFINKTIPQAVAELVRPHGLTLISDPHSRVFDQLTVSGHSTWEWIQEQAKRIGFGVTVEGTKVYFRHLDNLIDTKSSSVPVLSYFNSDAPMNNQALDRTLDSLRVLNGEHVEGQAYSRTNKLVAGIDPVTAKVVSFKHAPNKTGKSLRTKVGDVLFDEFQTSQVVNSHTAASASTEGAAAMARMSIPARITGQGDPRIRPFSPVYILGTGEDTDGYWLVKEVHHMFHKVGDYQIEAVIGTDGLGANNTSAFRKEPGSIVGQVDLTAALVKSSHAKAAKHGTRLEVKSPIIVQTKQGYNRTPARWKSSPKPGRTN